MTVTFDHRTNEYIQHVDRFLKDWYDRFSDLPQNRLFEAMSYSLEAGGKRIRPILVYEFCRLCGGNWQDAAPFAAAVEMIHTYSLIHDDLPCMDDDDYRRGKLTNHKVYGEAMAVLAGDALLTDAFAVASIANIPSKSLRDAVAVLAECAGSLGMVGGQVLDILSEERLLTEQEALDIQTRKTGALIRASCVLGAISAGASEIHQKAAVVFSANLGLTFQIRDDMLDVVGNAAELGKAIGVDGSKNTFVRLYGMEKCQQLLRMYTDRAVESLSVFDDPAYLTSLALQLINRTK